MDKELIPVISQGEFLINVEFQPGTSLSENSRIISEIAQRTGFSESSAFIRAFKTWTGTTPYTYRKGL